MRMWRREFIICRSNLCEERCKEAEELCRGIGVNVECGRWIGC